MADLEVTLSTAMIDQELLVLLHKVGQEPFGWAVQVAIGLSGQAASGLAGQVAFGFAARVAFGLVGQMAVGLIGQMAFGKVDQDLTLGSGKLVLDSAKAFGKIDQELVLESDIVDQDLWTASGTPGLESGFPYFHQVPDK